MKGEWERQIAHMRLMLEIHKEKMNNMGYYLITRCIRVRERELRKGGN